MNTGDRVELWRCCDYWLHNTGVVVVMGVVVLVVGRILVQHDVGIAALSITGKGRDDGMSSD